MKKVVCYGVIILIVIYAILVGYMLNNDISYYKDMKKNIELKDVGYINKYDNKYIVLDKENLYLYNNKYEEILKIDNENLCKRDKDYEIIYRDEEFQYLKENYQDGELIYEYINAYNCKFIEKIVLGGL